jgi:hypothetical protein
MLAERGCLHFSCCLLYLKEFLASCVMKSARCDMALLHLSRLLCSRPYNGRYCGLGKVGVSPQKFRTFRYGPRLLVQPESNMRGALGLLNGGALCSPRAQSCFLASNPIPGNESQSLPMHTMLRVRFLRMLALLFTVVVAVAVVDPGQGQTMVDTLEKRDLVDTLGPQVSSGASIYSQ